jgi:outer membrane biosynthesis protein TonB
MGPAELGKFAIDAEILERAPSEPEYPGTPAEPAPDAVPTVDGDLAPDLVRRIIRAHTKETKDCYAAAAKKTPELAGTLTVAFVIAKTGKVSKAEVVGEPLDPALGKCMTKALSRWTFPKPGDGEPVDASFPFAFPPP